jgi:predicted lipoprotein with Yx(FWY)xxD motif
MKMNRIALVAAAAALSLGALAGCSAASTPSTGGDGSTAAASGSSSSDAPAADAALKTSSTSLGSVVVNGEGMTVYVFDKDTAGQPSTCAGQCAALWPAVLTTDAKPAVDGVTGTVGTVATADGKQQLTLNGLPLYTYAQDKAAGDVAGQAVGGIWWVVGADGTKITTTATADSSGTGTKPGY